MPITRIFRVRIHAEWRQEFEEKFASISVDAVRKATGIRSVAIHRPTAWAPDEYAMISVWDDVPSLQSFAGERWNAAVIPPGMEKFVAECWVHHYASWTQS